MIILPTIRAELYRDNKMKGEKMYNKNGDHIIYTNTLQSQFYPNHFY